MSTSKRDRERARLREQKWTQRQAGARARRRRAWTVAAAVSGVALVAGVTALAVNANPPEKTYTLAPASAAQDREWTGELRTSAGDIAFTLDGKAAPQAVANFVSLAREKYFDGTDCHRLTTANIFILQCGDPTGTGTGGPGYEFGPVENTPEDGFFPAGTIAMARAQTTDSHGSQFFLVYEDTTLPTNTGGYTVFGKITSGLDVVRAVADAGTAEGTGNGSPATPVTIEGVETQ
ncbi:peptidylprolyl isomerase [Oerskovia turbata]|uniref:Peptidylprolyl isomerase n=1 Tax=Oerskovia turbata TaxID=1713 RepID=A0A4Q1KXT0_9CELL|nr:peptidylprolyl isomerase [Oerskovia turbata]RXR24789.1 peptidylprolyl isomerase [Oerskovia turbata]RXR35007.1 peptidylprolyl isomerase [Oerskovia turbata]TGJ97073.1 peptidylprolyl isomerase [Actinotalea fermentans ATCC 43279 = JCM 9966 = DSM 3133]